MKTPFIISSILASTVTALFNVGPAHLYQAPYTPPLACGEFQTTGAFVAVGDNLWNNGAACGRHYNVRCIAGPGNPCKSGGPVVKVTVVNYHSGSGVFLNRAAMSAIQKGTGQITVEFEEY